MKEAPLIIRVALAKDWLAAFEVVWIATFKLATREMGLPATDVSIEVGKPSADWDERRAVCRQFARRLVDEHGQPALAAAWAMLAVDPVVLPLARSDDDKDLCRIALVGVATAIAEQPLLLDDQALAKAGFGWRFLERHGRLAYQAGENDPLLVARAIGSPITIDPDETLQWARSWAVGR